MKATWMSITDEEAEQDLLERDGREVYPDAWISFILSGAHSCETACELIFNLGGFLLFHPRPAA